VASKPNARNSSDQQDVSGPDYQRLLSIRTRLRAFERWSTEQAARLGLTASQHQLLLAVRGHPEASGPTIGQAAAYLFLRHNTAVELADRTEQLGMVRRVADPDDQRVVRLQLTDRGRATLAALADVHLRELAELGPAIDHLVSDFGQDQASW